MYATTAASTVAHAARSARPRPFAVEMDDAHVVELTGEAAATAHVPSVDALSTIVIGQEKGNPALRYRCRRRTDAARHAASLKTGTTMSTSNGATRRSPHLNGGRRSTASGTPTVR